MTAVIFDTVWADDEDKESALQHNVQIQIGYDAADIWLGFNKKTSAVQLTHHDMRRLICELQGALVECDKLAVAEIREKGE